jgi:hypothetical protein
MSTGIHIRIPIFGKYDVSKKHCPNQDRVDKNRNYAQVLEERNAAGGILASYLYGDDLISQDRSKCAHPIERNRTCCQGE